MSKHRAQYRISSAMSVVAVALLASVLPPNGASLGAERTLHWVDPAFCEFEIKFDPIKYGEQQLRNTIDLIFNGWEDEPPLDPDPALRGPNVSRFRERCSGQTSRLTTLPLIDLPGLEVYRKMQLDLQKDYCDFETIRIRGLLGDAAALRLYTASSTRCSRFIDALEGKIDLKTVWRDVVESTCKDNAKPDVCRTTFFAAESGQNSTEKIWQDVVGYGWNNCSTPYLGAHVDTKSMNSLEASLRRRFSARFKMTVVSQCGD